jgi:ubiquinone/menaquinone biosynthesis C-methylase UbiE
MPSIEQNLEVWGKTYDWSQAEKEWSDHWGNADTQWFYTLLPRIHSFIPTGTILEIAPGFGRWTQYLINQCQHLMLVDLSENCIEACKERFSKYDHISYFVNEGKSLEFIPDGSIDFVFSFDSLVHAEDNVLEAYLEQLAYKLTPNGAGFFHHSNLGESLAYRDRVQKLPYRLKKRLEKMNVIETLEAQWRDPSMTAQKFEQMAERAGMQCIGQEIINWESKRTIDCISTFTQKGSAWASENRVIRNNKFMQEAEYSAQLASLYSGRKSINLTESAVYPSVVKPGEVVGD